MEKKHDFMFCPQCGVKLEGNEFICPTCRYKLAEQTVHKSEAPVIPPLAENIVPLASSSKEKLNVIRDRLVENIVPSPPPITPPSPPLSKTETPVTPPINQYVPPVAQQNVYQQPYYRPQSQKKKDMGAGRILIILLIIIVLGGGTIGVLQYTGTINIKMLNNIIPAKESNNSQTPVVVNHTRYYVVYSFAVLGSKWNAIISGIVVSNRPFNNEEGAKNQFKKAIMAKYPKDYHNFFNNIICNQYKSLPEVQSAHSSLVKSYGAKNYEIKTVNFAY